MFIANCCGGIILFHYIKYFLDIGKTMLSHIIRRLAELLSEIQKSFIISFLNNLPGSSVDVLRCFSPSST